MCICTHTHMYVCFEGEKKAQKISPPAADETPDPIIYQVQSISNTFTHSTSSGTKHLGFRGGAAGAMERSVRCSGGASGSVPASQAMMTTTGGPWSSVAFWGR